MYWQRRRRIRRNIHQSPETTFFKPAWVQRNRLEQVELLIDEYEAIRLSDIEDLNMKEGAEKMWISAPTFHRILQSAHKKIADAIVNGKWIKINNEQE